VQNFGGFICFKTNSPEKFYTIMSNLNEMGATGGNLYLE
jgi:hypothetical protein